MPLSPGDRLGPYEITAPIGAGGMGEVYRARDPRLGRDIAIKILPAALVTDPDRRNRFEQEARAASALNHPNIISIFDIGSHDGILYVVEELLEGETMRERVKQGPIPPRKAIEYAVQVAHGLAAAHEKAIVHRDLKPENLFLIRDGRVKILDFGLAKLGKVNVTTPDGTSAPTEALGTQPGMVMGTVGYMSPEQVRGRAVDHRSDIFSFGAILYEALTGKRAFEAGSAVETMSAILNSDPPELAVANRSLPPAMDRIVRHCLEKNPDERFHSARDLAFDLESLSNVSVPVLAVAGTVPRTWLRAAGAVAMGLALGFLMAHALLPARGINLGEYRFTALATEQGAKVSPAWSPDGKALTYVQVVEGVNQVFTRSLAQPTPVQLTRAQGDCADPFWAPDGARIFYAGRSKGVLGIWSIGAAGGDPELLVADARSAAISPDGKTMAFTRVVQDGAIALWTQSLPGGEPRKFAGPLPHVVPYAYPYMRFSPDGSQIGIVLLLGEGRDEFWVLSYPGGQARRAAAATSIMPGPWSIPFNWFPDSRHIVFSGVLSKSGGNHLMIADTRSGSVQPLTAAFRNEGDPSVSADGTKIAFSSAEEDTDLVEVPLDGTPMRKLLATSRGEHCAAWSPVRHQFGYSKNRDGTDEIWLRSPTEGWERPLITGNNFAEGHTDRVSEIRFSPDGQRIVFIRVSGGEYRIWVASVAGGPPVPLTEDASSQALPAWSPDGKWIAFYSGKPGQGDAVLAKASAGGKSRAIRLKVPAAQSELTRTQWSPRGDWLVWLTVVGLYVVSPDGNRSELVSPERDWRSYGFSQDGSSVLGVRLDLNHHWLLSSIDLGSKKEKVLHDFGPLSDIKDMHGFSLAPEGKSFATSVTYQLGDIWMLEGFPRPAQLFERWWTR